MLVCPKCDTHVDNDDATVCPTCGYSFKPKPVAATLRIAFILAAAISVMLFFYNLSLSGSATDATFKALTSLVFYTFILFIVLEIGSRVFELNKPKRSPCQQPSVRGNFDSVEAPYVPRVSSSQAARDRFWKAVAVFLLLGVMFWCGLPTLALLGPSIRNLFSSFGAPPATATQNRSIPSNTPMPIVVYQPEPTTMFTPSPVPTNTDTPVLCKDWSTLTLVDNGKEVCITGSGYSLVLVDGGTAGERYDIVFSARINGVRRILTLIFPTGHYDNLRPANYIKEKCIRAQGIINFYYEDTRASMSVVDAISCP